MNLFVGVNGIGIFKFLYSADLESESSDGEDNEELVSLIKVFPVPQGHQINRMLNLALNQQNHS